MAEKVSSFRRQAEATTRWMIERIEAALASGEKLTWAQGHDLGLPRNFTTGRYYRGWNVFRCWMAGFERPLFAGIGQIGKLGARVKRDEMTSPTWIMLWQRREVEETNERGEEKKRSFWFSKALKVWNADQCEGLPDLPNLARPEGVVADAELEAFFAAAAAADGITVRENAATIPCYAPGADEVRMPARSSFHGASEWYGALAHEMVHATGAEKRLDRKLFGMGRACYSKEELVAEFGAAILGAILGFDAEPHVENHAAYLRGWLSALQDDPMLLVEGASAAQKAVDRLLEKAGDALPSRCRELVAVRDE